MHSELKPCPFCGWDTPAICGNADVGNAWVSCDRCGAQSGGFQDAEKPQHILRDFAAGEWNRRAPSPSPAPGVVEALPENVLEDAAKAAFIKAQSVYRGLHDHLPLKNTWETLTESIRDGWRAIAHAALEAAYMPPLGTQPEPRLPRDVPSALASLSQPHPANPAQGVTGSMKRDFAAWLEDQDGAVSLYQAYHAGRTAAIGAGGQAVAWQGRDHPDERWQFLRKPPGVGAWAETRPLYTHPAPSGQAVAVKALEWHDKTIPLMRYFAECDDDGKWRYAVSGAKMTGPYTLKRYGAHCGEYPTIEAAQVAAQTDHEARILSALAHPVQPGWRDMESAPKDGTRVLLVWKPFGGLSEHVELGKWKARQGWSNTYGHAFNGDPDAWAPLAPFALPTAPQPKGE